VFGYTGTLHADRTDVDLILDLARSFPDGRIMLVGPNFLSNRDRGRLAEVPNITVTGAVPYARVPEMMREFDICIVPHRETPFTDSLNPLKLWEYLACGKPIVSTNVAGFRDYTHLCSVASGSEAFVGACRAALHDKGTRRSDRIAEACRHTWGQRVDALLDALEEKQWLV
jgi:glycosyltransferase involved in cell wall biosynthesis